jgi:hypothetical protein
MAGTADVDEMKKTIEKLKENVYLGQLKEGKIFIGDAALLITNLMDYATEEERDSRRIMAQRLNLCVRHGVSPPLKKPVSKKFSYRESLPATKDRLNWDIGIEQALTKIVTCRNEQVHCKWDEVDFKTLNMYLLENTETIAWLAGLGMSEDQRNAMSGYLRELLIIADEIYSEDNPNVASRSSSSSAMLRYV